MGASKGVIRRLPLDSNIIMDYIPVDVVTNAIITTGYYVDALKWVIILLYEHLKRLIVQLGC